MAAGGGAAAPTTTDCSDPISDHGTGKLKEVTYVNPYTWESERARASTKLNRTTRRRNKRRPPGMTIMDRTINKLRKLRESWQEENAGREADFRLGCNWKERDVSLKPYVEQPFGTIPTLDGGLCGLSKEVASQLSSSVVAIALFDGDVMLFASTAIVLPYRTIQLRRFLTSARLVEAFIENRNKEDELNIRVCLPNKNIVNGFLELYDDTIAVIASLSISWMRPVELNGYNTFMAMMSPGMAGAVVGRSFGLYTLMATTWKLKLTDEGVMNLDCSITEAALGGLLVDLSGNFCGMITDCGREGILFMTRHMIFERLYTFRLLEHNRINVQEAIYAGMECLDGPNPHGAGSSIGETKTNDEVYSMPSDAKKIAPSGFLRDLNVLYFRGYPEPPPLMLELNGKLLHTFEEDFGYLHAWRGYTYSLNICGDGMNAWARLEENIISTISRRVVSLSSYNGNIRFFSCTGLLVKDLLSFPQRRSVILTSASLVRTCDEPDTIDKNLTIEVFLPPKQHAIGTLESYDSHHNIAIVSFKGLRAIRPEDISDHKQVLPLHVVAIGREPEEGLLCASTGKLTDKPITALPCKHLELSTCEIKKAGIGGPLINFDDGSFIGMNFYDGKTKGTPFLPRSKILEVLSRLEPLPGRGTQRGGDHPAPILDGRAETNNTKRWPVPQAYWHNELLKMDWDEGRKFVRLDPCRF